MLANIDNFYQVLNLSITSWIAPRTTINKRPFKQNSVKYAKPTEFIILIQIKQRMCLFIEKRTEYGKK
jgi:hypothetical protein